MSQTPSGKDWYDGIVQTHEPRHDTLYCTHEQFQELWDEATHGMNTLSGQTGAHEPDEFRIYGLTVQAHEQIKTPIVCEKGEVFPLAKDWKDE